MEILEFLDVVAEESKIEIDQAPLKMLEELNGFSNVIRQWVYEEDDCIVRLAENLLVGELIQRVDQRNELEKELTKYEGLCAIGPAQIRAAYRSVMPQLGAHENQIAELAPAHREIVANYRFRFLEEQQVVAKQELQEKIQDQQ